MGVERRLAHESPTLALPRSTRGGEEDASQIVSRTRLGAAGSNESLGITCPLAHGPHERAKALAHDRSEGPSIHGGFPEAEEFKTI